jgi:hypothetical protein
MPGSTAHDDILVALRLGWAVAELRGRYRRLAHPAHHHRKPTHHPRRTDNALPLGDERSLKERAIEIEKVTYALTGRMRLDLPCNELSGQPETNTEKASRFLPTLTGTFISRTSTPELIAATWPRFSEFLYAWDAAIQDSLAAKTFGQTSAYQLGRGLAEAYWALEHDAASNEIVGWESLLGPDRQRLLSILLTRLTPYLDPLTAQAIAAAIAAWGEVAADEALRAKSATEDALRQQVDLWRDLLLTGRDPTSLIPPDRALASARSVWPALKAFRVQIALTLAGVALLSAAAWLGISAGSNHALGSLLAILGVFGVTSAGLQARVKQSSNELLGRLRLALDLDLVRTAATLPPAREKLPGPSRDLRLRGRASARPSRPG